MPCQELFDKQSQEYKEKVIEKKLYKNFCRGWQHIWLGKICWP